MKNFIKDASEHKNKHLKFCIVIAALLTIISLLYFFVVPYVYPDNTKLTINKTYGIVLWELDIISTNYENLAETEKAEMLNTFELSTGLDYKKLLSNIPEIYSEKNFYYHKAPELPIDFNNKKYILHDYIFHLRTPEQAHITIKICPFEKPLINVGFTPITSVKSDINGVKIAVYSIGKQLKHLMIEFIYNNSYYEIETYNVRITEVEKLLNIILQQ